MSPKVWNSWIYSWTIQWREKTFSNVSSFMSCSTSFSLSPLPLLIRRNSASMEIPFFTPSQQSVTMGLAGSHCQDKADEVFLSLPVSVISHPRAECTNDMISLRLRSWFSVVANRHEILWSRRGSFAMLLCDGNRLRLWFSRPSFGRTEFWFSSIWFSPILPLDIFSTCLLENVQVPRKSSRRIPSKILQTFYNKYPRHISIV